MACGYSEEEIEDVRNMLRGIAQDRGEPEEEVRNVIEEYVACVFSNPRPEVQERLKTCPRTGELPTPEEFLLWFLPQIPLGW